MKLTTTREDRDAVIAMADAAGKPARLARDCNALEDELARVREEFNGIYESNQHQLDAAYKESAKLRDELAVADDALLRYARHDAEMMDERDKLREELDSLQEERAGIEDIYAELEAARRVINVAQVQALGCWPLQQAIAEHDERFGGRE